MHEFDKHIEEAMRARPAVRAVAAADAYDGNNYLIEKGRHYDFDDVSPLLDGVCLYVLEGRNDDRIDTGFLGFNRSLCHIAVYGCLTGDNIDNVKLADGDADAYAAYVGYRKALVELYGEDFDMEYVQYARDNALAMRRLHIVACKLEREIDRIAKVNRMGFEGVLNAILVEHEKRCVEEGRTLE